MAETANDLRQQFVGVLLKQLGKPYVWASNGPNDFDCSGLMVYGLRQVGAISGNDDYSARGFFNICPKTELPLPGDLAFYGQKPDKVSHVVCIIDGVRVISASGGDSRTTSQEIARKMGALVKLHSSVLYRADFLGIGTNHFLEKPNV